MKQFCRFTDEAVADIVRAADQYDRHFRGSGSKFIEEVHRTIGRMARFPNAYAETYRSIRRICVGRFPYFVTYQIFVGELVVVGVFAETRTLD